MRHCPEPSTLPSVASGRSSLWLGVKITLIVVIVTATTREGSISAAAARGHQTNYMPNYLGAESGQNLMKLRRSPDTTLTPNTTTISAAKRDKFQLYSPSYDIVDIDQPDAVIQLITQNHKSGKNLSENNDFMKNLTKLKKIVNAKRRQEATRKQSRANETMRDSKLDDDITTINVLISMLMLANKRLIEQRDKRSNVTRSTNSGTGKRPEAESDRRILLDSRISLPDSVGSGPNATNLMNTKLATGAKKSKKKKKKIKSAEALISPADESKHPTHFNMSQELVEKRQRNTTLSPRYSDHELQRAQSSIREDHSLVKPGFDSDDSERGSPESQSAERSTGKGRPKEGLARASQHPTAAYHLSQQPQPASEDLLRGHAPIVAQDLLYVRPQQHPTTAPYSPLNQDNMFVSRPTLPRHHPLYEYLQQHQQATSGASPFELAHLRVGGHPNQPPAEPPEQHEGPQPQTPLVPPYNGRPLDWTHHSQRHPLAQRLGEEDPYSSPQLGPTMRPLVETSSRPDAGPTAGNELAGEQQPTRGPEEQPNELNGQSPFMDPIQRMLMAAKNQQAAAMAYERRRIEHELELQRRQQLAKKQHDEQLEKQRQAYLAAAQKQAEAGRESEEQPPPANEQQPAQQPEGQQQQQVDNQVNNQANGRVSNNQPGEQQAGQQENSQGNQSPPEEQQQPEGGGGDSGNGGGDDQQQQQDNGEQQADDPDMKNFQSFAGDTDFTDLFPPGVLSDEEIREMRRDQAEQRQRQEQEEREKQQQQQSEEQDGQEGGGQENAQDSESEQQPSSKEGEQDLAAKSQEKEPVEAPAGAQQTALNGSIEATNRTLTNLVPTNQSTNSVQQATLAKLPAPIKLESGANGNLRANKTRRSHDQDTTAARVLDPRWDEDSATGHLLSVAQVDPLYHRLYIRPFLAADSGASAARPMAPPLLEPAAGGRPLRDLHGSHVEGNAREGGVLDNSEAGALVEVTQRRGRGLEQQAAGAGELASPSALPSNYDEDHVY